MHVYPTKFSLSQLQRFTSCPRAFQLHDLTALPGEPDDARAFAAVLRRTCSEALREHASGNRAAGLDAGRVVATYRTAWIDSGFSDSARFEEGLAIVKSWALRQGVVEGADVLGVDQPFVLSIGPCTVTGTLDRVDRAGDTLRVRALSAARIPMSREDAAGNLQIAVYDLAARHLWPQAEHVEVEVELLRHGSVLRLSRSDEQREATRVYLRATLDQIDRGMRLGGDLQARPTLRCTSCTHRSHCGAYADALAARRAFISPSDGDLEGVAREREEVARLVKVLSGRKDALEAVLRARIEADGELRAGGMRYSIGTTTYTDYPVGATLALLGPLAAEDTGPILDRIAAVRAPAVRKVLEELSASMTPEEIALLRETLEGLAQKTFSTRLIAKEETP
jgi:RecB family exonuclease